MQQLILTKEHKVQLLEMGNKLFSEKGNWFTVNNGRVFCSNTGKYPGVSIHWFEFCMTHLISKIQIKNNKNYLTSICSSINLSASNNSENEYKWNHPIDYLYEEFKKLK